MPTPLVLPSFAAGEVSPAVHGRVDLAKYAVGLRTCLNFFVMAQGGVSTRAGTAFVGEQKDSAARGRLLPFQFNQVQTYIIVAENLAFRFIMNGGFILETAVNITGISLANPGVVTAVAHGFANGDHVWLDGIVGTTQLNRRRITVAGATANTFTIGIDTTGYTAWASGGTVARFYTVVTPYVTADLSLLKFVQSADTMTITHPSYAPRNLTRTGHTAWTLTTITFVPGQAAPTAFVSSSGPGGVFYAVTAVNDTTGEESLPLLGSALNRVSTLTFTAAGGATSYNFYNLRNDIYGFIGTSGLGGFTDATITSDSSDTPPAAANPFTGADLYPGCSTYHDGRQWFARTNTRPQTLYASGSANFASMATSRPTKDSDAITRTIASREVNEIRFLLSLNVLLVFTSGGEWKCWAGSQADVITPANCNVKPQGYNGIAQIAPIATNSSALFVAASGRKVRDVAYDFGSDSYTGRDMSILSGHLFEGKQIEEWAYAKDPDGIIWCVRSDGVLLGFTYLKEHDVYAWSRHTTDGTVESVAAIQESNETILYLAIKRTIGGVTKRYVERMASRYFADVAASWCVDCGYSYNGWNTDTTRTLLITGGTFNPGDTVALVATGHAPFTSASVGKKYILRSGQNQVTVTVTVYSSTNIVFATLDQAPHVSVQAATWDWALATLTLGGLWHLEGKTVAILADGSVHANQTVANGGITLTHAAGRVVAGLPFVADLETLDIERQPTLQGRQKRVTEIVLRVKDTRGLSVGPDEERLVEIKERGLENENMGQPTELTTGDERVLIDPLWDSNGRVFLRQSFPLPATVVAIIPALETGA